ncbi:TonB-dependent receptor domain-containing protein [Pseudomonas aeruginosa]
MYRETYSVTHRGEWDFSDSLAYLQYEKTRSSRINEGLAGGTEGIFDPNNAGFSPPPCDLTAHGEVSLPLHLGHEQTLTLGSEWTEQKLDDPSSNTQNTRGRRLDPRSRRKEPQQQFLGARIFSLFAGDNIELMPGTMLTPGLRWDHHDIVGDNWSPSLVCPTRSPSRSP